MKPKLENQIFSTNYQKVLKFLAAEAGQEYMEREISGAAGISKAGANIALRSLVADGLIEVEKKGRLSLYHADIQEPKIRQVKVLINLLEINDLVDSLSSMSEKIILFGSAATGTNAEDSDIDLFVLSNDPDAVRKVVINETAKRHIHLVVRTLLEFMASKKKDRIFFDEVSRGIVLYENQA